MSKSYVGKRKENTIVNWEVSIFRKSNLRSSQGKASTEKKDNPVGTQETAEVETRVSYKTVSRNEGGLIIEA